MKVQEDRLILFPSPTTAEVGAVKMMRKLLINPPILAFSDPTSQYTLEHYSGDCWVRYVILQKEEDRTICPLEYWSRMLTGAKQKLTNSHKDWEVLVRKMLVLWRYTGLSRFLVRTDHEAVEYFLTYADTLVKLKSWKLRLLDLDREIVNWAGVKHWEPKPLSTLNTKGPGMPGFKEEVPVLMKDEAWEPHNVETECLDAEQSTKEQNDPTWEHTTKWYDRRH